MQRRASWIAPWAFVLLALPASGGEDSCESRYRAEIEAAKRAAAEHDSRGVLEHLVRADALLGACASESHAPNPRDPDENGDEVPARAFARR